MSGKLRAFSLGGGVFAGAVGVYLLLTPPGRALVFALGAPTPGMPRAEVEGALGEPDAPAPAGNSFCIGLRSSMSQKDFDRAMESRASCVRYLGPLYAVDVQYVGFRDERFESVHLWWEPTWAGMLTPVGLIFFSAVAVSRWSRTRKRQRESWREPEPHRLAGGMDGGGPWPPLPT